MANGTRWANMLTHTIEAHLQQHHETRTFKQAMSSGEKDNWKQANDDEFQSLLANNTFTLVPRPCNVFVLPVMWIFAIKLAIGGLVDRYKARLV